MSEDLVKRAWSSLRLKKFEARRSRNHIVVLVLVLVLERDGLPTGENRMALQSIRNSNRRRIQRIFEYEDEHEKILAKMQDSQL